jgi:hypothetical protein
LLDIGLALLTLTSRCSIAEFVAEFFPPDLSADWLAKVAGHLGNPGHFGRRHAARAVAGLLLALPRWRAPFSFLLNTLRSVPELVWATITVLAVGLGPFAGALALALHTTGVLGRLYAEALDNAPPAPARCAASGRRTRRPGLPLRHPARRRAAADRLHALPLGNEHPHGRHPRLRRRRRAGWANCCISSCR